MVRGPKGDGAAASRIQLALGANALTPRHQDLQAGTWARDLTTTAMAMVVSTGPQVEVADKSMVRFARRLAWSQVHVGILSEGSFPMH